MYRVRLTDAQRQELKRRAHEPGVMPRTRDRLEMVRLSAAGWSPPRIAAHLDLSQQTVRQWIKAFLNGGFEALPDQPHLGQSSAITPAIEEAIRQELRRDERTWTAAQLAEWVGERFGVHRTAAHLARRLDRAGIAYKRTGRSLKHKQNPDEVAAKQEEMTALEKRGTRARSTSPTSTKRESP
jgi:putative transposase